DGNKSYAKLASEIGCSKQTITNTINKDLGYSSYKKSSRPQVEGDPGVAVGEPPLPLEPRLGIVENKTNKHAHNTLDSLRAAIVEEFANMK
ncbi:Uncharacterized protein FKW44_020661, partial [Caligus rogercresseyi]